MNPILEELQQVLEERKSASPDSSYVARLYDSGLNKILEKVGEESIEVILAAKDCASGGERSEVVGETADLWFHCLVMLRELDIDLNEVLEELERRFGLSGVEEKAARGGPGT